MVKPHIVSIGFLTHGVTGFMYDYLLYPFTIGIFGAFAGGTIMTIASLIINYALVLLYRKTKEDWFGFEALRLKRAEEGGESKLLRFFLRFGYYPAFVGLSVYDPFLAFVYIQGRENPSHTFTIQDWKVFIVSNLICGLIWTSLVSGALYTLRLAFF